MTDPAADLVIAYVEWVDASSVGALEWQDPDPAADRALDLATTSTIAAGILVEQTDAYVVLALMRNESNGELASVVMIPRATIRRVDIWAPLGPGGDGG